MTQPDPIGPTPEAYVLAAAAWGESPTGNWRPVVDTVWPVAFAAGVAEGRRQAVAEIIAFLRSFADNCPVEWPEPHPAAVYRHGDCAEPVTGCRDSARRNVRGTGLRGA